MSNTKHTPLPWSVATSHDPYSAEYLKNKVWGPEGPGHGTVCETNRTLAGHADARHIVACVNGCKDLNPAAYKESVEVLKYVRRKIDESEEWWMDSPDRGGFDADRIDAAIANARNTEAGR